MPMKFNELGLMPSLLKAVNEKGYTDPSPIQEKAIPLNPQKKRCFSISANRNRKNSWLHTTIITDTIETIKFES